MAIKPAGLDDGVHPPAQIIGVVIAHLKRFAISFAYRRDVGMCRTPGVAKAGFKPTKALSWLSGVF